MDQPGTVPGGVADQGLDGARPVPGEQDVGAGEQCPEPFESTDVPQVEQRRPLSLPVLEMLPRDLGQGRWIDPQHVGPEQRERARRDRAGDHAGEIQNAHPGQRLRGGTRRSVRRPVAAGVNAHECARRCRDTGGTRCPLLLGADADRDRLARGCPLLHFCAGQGRDTSGEFCSRAVRGQFDDVGQSGAVVGIVRMRADPAVRDVEEARQLREPRDRSAVSAEHPVTGERGGDPLRSDGHPVRCVPGRDPHRVGCRRECGHRVHREVEGGQPGRQERMSRGSHLVKARARPRICLPPTPEFRPPRYCGPNVSAIARSVVFIELDPHRPKDETP